MKVTCKDCGEVFSPEDFDVIVEKGTIPSFIIRCPNYCSVAEVGFEELSLKVEEGE